MAERPADELRYKAFLSYSHKDAAAAGRLHRRLEAYRMPKRLVGRQTVRGPVPQRLAPIFRDREEMAAASDLSDTVRAALAESAALVVLCSPNAAGSLWVSEEIATFRRLYPDRPVLAAILAGDPPACFPTALRVQDPDGIWHEPLATDLRREGDGPHLGLLKLVAGITGVALDDLVQRDAARRLRRVTAVTAGALIAVLIMAALTLFALDARREAERQRAEAEGLIEFMLTDLRERLKGVGRLDVMASVNDRALSYYGSREGAGAGSAMRARVVHAIGEDYLARGDSQSAFAHFRRAYRHTADLVRASPTDPDRLFAHGQSQFWIGEAHFGRGEWAQSQRYFSDYAKTAQQLLRLAPHNHSYMMEAGYAATNLGKLRLRGFRDVQSARASFLEALSWFEQAERARPGDENALLKQGNSHAWIADTFYEERQWRQSLNARRRQLAIFEQLHRADPSNRDRLYLVALAQRAVGSNLSLLGDREGASFYFTNAYRNARSLTQHDPANADWLYLRGAVSCALLYDHFVPVGSASAANLSRETAAAAAALSAQRDSQARELTRCIAAAQQRGPA